MMPTIRIEDDVFEGLKLLAEPFVDTPNTVIRRLLAGQVLPPSGVVKPGQLAESKVSTRAKPYNVSSKAANPLTPQSIYEQFLLHCLGSAKGEATKHDATQAVMKLMKAHGFIEVADLEKVQTGETKAENTIAWARNALKDQGLISRNSPRGLWALTDEGKTKALEVVLPRK